MKQLTWKLVIPFTILSFVFFAKLWHVDIHGFNETLKGFPLPYVCKGWHTSMSLQVFVVELIVDVLVHFSFWFLVVLNIVKFVGPFKMPRFVTIPLLVVTGPILVMLIVVALMPEHMYYLKRPFEIDVINTEYRFFD